MTGRGAVALLVLLAGCTSESALVVELRTDFVPGIEIVGAHTEVTAIDLRTPVEQIDVAIASGAPVRDGMRTAELESLSPGRYRVVVELRAPDGSIAARRATIVDFTGHHTVTILITRDCATTSIACPRAGEDPSHTECHGGQCVDPDCNDGNPSACGTVECAAHADCTAAASCAQAECTLGVCTSFGDDSMCGASEYCNPDLGCRPRTELPDAGPPPEMELTGAISGLFDHPGVRVHIHDVTVAAWNGTDDLATCDAGETGCLEVRALEILVEGPIIASGVGYGGGGGGGGGAGDGYNTGGGAPGSRGSEGPGAQRGSDGSGRSGGGGGDGGGPGAGAGRGGPGDDGRNADVATDLTTILGGGGGGAGGGDGNQGCCRPVTDRPMRGYNGCGGGGGGGGGRGGGIVRLIATSAVHLLAPVRARGEHGQNGGAGEDGTYLDGTATTCPSGSITGGDGGRGGSGGRSDFGVGGNRGNCTACSTGEPQNGSRGGRGGGGAVLIQAPAIEVTGGTVDVEPNGVVKIFGPTAPPITGGRLCSGTAPPCTWL